MEKNINLKKKKTRYPLIITGTALIIGFAMEIFIYEQNLSTPEGVGAFVGSGLGMSIGLLIIPIIVFYMFFLFSKNKSDGLRNGLILSLIIIIIHTYIQLSQIFYEIKNSIG